MASFFITHQAIRAARSALHMSQAEFASALGYSRETVARWEGTDAPRAASVENHISLYARSRGLTPMRNGDLTVGYMAFEDAEGNAVTHPYLETPMDDPRWERNALPEPSDAQWLDATAKRYQGA